MHYAGSRFEGVKTSFGVEETASKRRKIETTSIWWARSIAAFNSAAGSGHLEVVKWLHANRYRDWTPNGMDNAAGKAYLEVVKWLHANTNTECTERAMDNAARNGHLEVVKWLHANTNVGCTVRAIDDAAKTGRLGVVKWLHANRSEGCTYRAFSHAISNGHLRVAFWLRSKFPNLAPPNNRFWIHSKNQFDVLLFLQVNCLDIFTTEFGQEAKYNYSGDAARPGDYLIEEWLEDNYPGYPIEEE